MYKRWEVEETGHKKPNKTRLERMSSAASLLVQSVVRHAGSLSGHVGGGTRGRQLSGGGSFPGTDAQQTDFSSMFERVKKKGLVEETNDEFGVVQSSESEQRRCGGKERQCQGSGVLEQRVGQQTRWPASSGPLGPLQNSVWPHSGLTFFLDRNGPFWEFWGPNLRNGPSEWVLFLSFAPPFFEVEKNMNLGNFENKSKKHPTDRPKMHAV